MMNSNTTEEDSTVGDCLLISHEVGGIAQYFWGEKVTGVYGKYWF